MIQAWLNYIVLVYVITQDSMISQEPCIGFIQENLIEFLVQCIYLIYTRLIIYAISVLAYLKGYTYYILLTYNVTNFIQHVSLQPVDWFSQTKLH